MIHFYRTKIFSFFILLTETYFSVYIPHYQVPFSECSRCIRLRMIWQFARPERRAKYFAYLNEFINKLKDILCLLA